MVKIKERRHTKDIHQQITLFLFFPFTSTENKIGDTGATSLSETLKSNTTLTSLSLDGEDKRRHKRHPSTSHSFPFLFSSTGNIGDTGATSLSETLKSNTTLTRLSLGSEDKKKHTQKTYINNSLFLFYLYHGEIKRCFWIWVVF